MGRLGRLGGLGQVRQVRQVGVRAAPAIMGQVGQVRMRVEPVEIRGTFGVLIVFLYCRYIFSIGFRF